MGRCRLSAWIFSGGESRRMGKDKALLAHPDGGVWLTASVETLQPLGLPIHVVTRHQSHRECLRGYPDVTVLLEPAPWSGPLQALARVLPVVPDEAVLVLPVDMPCLTTEALQRLVEAWQDQPDRVAVAHDGQRLQPLLAVVPAGPPFQTALLAQVQAGRYRWLEWLQRVPHQVVSLPPSAMVNANCPEDLAALSS